MRLNVTKWRETHSLATWIKGKFYGGNEEVNSHVIDNPVQYTGFTDFSWEEIRGD